MNDITKGILREFQTEFETRMDTFPCQIDECRLVFTNIIQRPSDSNEMKEHAKRSLMNRYIEHLHDDHGVVPTETLKIEADKAKDEGFREGYEKGVYELMAAEKLRKEIDNERRDKDALSAIKMFMGRRS